MAATRHPVLYDLLPWRHWRYHLGALGILLLVAGGLLNQLLPGNETVPNSVGLGGVAVLGVCVSMAIRARRTWISVDGDGVHYRSARRRLDVPAVEVLGVQVGQLSALVADSPRYAKRALRPEWVSRKAVSVRIARDSAPFEKAKRRLPERVVNDDQLVVPIENCEGFRSECVAALGTRIVAGRGRRSGAPRSPRKKNRR